MKINEIIQYLEQTAPSSFQEGYDNAGLITGNKNWDFNGAIICLDSTEAVIDEAIAMGVNMVIAHHPIVFKGLKKINGNNYVERTIIKAIKNDIAIYAIHTNLDSVLKNGVNTMICEKLGLKNLKILNPKKGILKKLVAFIPKEYTEQVLDALHQAGAGSIGNYSNCSFKTEGTGTFTPNDSANPTIGNKNTKEEVIECRVEVIFEDYKEKNIIDTLKAAHPYEEVAYHIQSLDNEHQEVGAGMIGELERPVITDYFLEILKAKLGVNIIRHTSITKDNIKRVAVCGGSGSFLLNNAIQQNADIYISADFKYHEFFDADGHIIIADIGHYESEQFTKDLIFNILSKKFINFAFHLTKINTNPINYL
jgi:dinuclear metal center YbgI/SA1388 family protein